MKGNMKGKGAVLLAAAAVAAAALVIVSRRDRGGEAPPRPSAPPAGAGQSRGGAAPPGKPAHAPTDEERLGVAMPPPLPLGEVGSRLADLELSPAARTVIGMTPGRADAKSRSKAMNELTTRLSEADVEGLSLFLRLRYDDTIGIPLKTWNVLRNDVLDILLRQEELRDGLGLQMAAMYHDRGQDDVWRDYCVQYLAGYYDRRYPAGTEEPQTVEREEMLRTYWSAASEKDKTIAGTALIGLEDLSRRHQEVDRRRVSDRAYELAVDEDCSEASRITSIRLCGMMGRKDVLPTARVLAQTAETTTLRMAAIATLGDLGGEGDVPLLESLAGSVEERIARIAEQALEKVRRAVAEGTNAPRSVEGTTT